MSYFGSVLFFVWLLIVTPIFSFIAIVVSPLPPLIRYRIIAVWSRSVIAALRILCGVRYRVIGADNIPPTPAVFLSRHESAWETIAFQSILPPQAFVAKKSLLAIPFFGWGLRQMSPIAIDRAAAGKTMRQMLRQGRERLAAGFYIIVFPEGTRLAPAEERRYLPGGAGIAKKNDVAVVPIALDSGKCWPRGAFFKRPGVITVQIGAPIDTADLSVDEINKKTKDWISAARLGRSGEAS